MSKAKTIVTAAAITTVAYAFNKPSNHEKTEAPQMEVNLIEENCFEPIAETTDKKSSIKKTVPITKAKKTISYDLAKTEKEQRKIIWNHLTKILHIIKYMETENGTHPTQIGDNGASHGLLQIKKVTVREANNQSTQGRFTYDDRMNDEKAIEMFYIIMKAGIKKYYKKHKVMPDDYTIVRWWNGGIYNGHLKTGTLVYLEKYKKYKKRQIKRGTIKPFNDHVIKNSIKVPVIY